MTIAQEVWDIAEPGENPVIACGHSCVCASPKGMATNGPCRCDERNLRRATAYWRQAAKYWQWKAEGGKIGDAAPTRSK